jgi:hypothetical protein
VTMHKGSIEFEEAANAMADECFLYSYWGIFYNMPAQHGLEPPFYCVMQGRYIRVFPSHIWWVFTLSLTLYLTLAIGILWKLNSRHQAIVLLCTSLFSPLFWENRKFIVPSDVGLQQAGDTLVGLILYSIG